ncbi:MAG: potassium-transporting ATPase subunit KdpA [Acidobacteria bacterium]|nr:potassium-transporting ATPase subunit KdpA [Acidobacteriota bacterium]
MMIAGYLEAALTLLVLSALAVALGRYVAQTMQGERTRVGSLLEPIEAALLRGARVERREMRWGEYAVAALVFNAVGFVILYGLLRIQHLLPLNPLHLTGLDADSAFNVAVSFVTNTNWQNYGGEATLSYFAQAAGLTVQNFLSAATGLAVFAAVARGFARGTSQSLGNFWIDLTRATVYVLLPLAMVLALMLVASGVPQTFDGPQIAKVLDPGAGTGGAEQEIQVGPVASQVAIKQLGTNGGGYFNTNSAHPFENPTPLSNFVQLLAILLLPASCCFAFGHFAGDHRQGRALFLAMLLPFVVAWTITFHQELAGSSSLAVLLAPQDGESAMAQPNLEGKEVRFGVASSTLWAVATTAASNGSVNSMHDSYMPLGGMIPMWMMQLGEVIFGGVGSGLYGMLLFVVVAVFVAGLLVGRTPEYLGKKIEAREMQMAMIGILVPTLFVLAGTALAVATDAGRSTITNPGPHGLSQVLYALSSAANNNGSAFAGLGVDTPFYNTLLGIAMLFGRYWVMVAALAVAGALAGKKVVPPGVGTLPTHGWLFGAWLVAVVLMVGALSFLPALALGPIAEHVTLTGR